MLTGGESCGVDRIRVEASGRGAPRLMAFGVGWRRRLRRNAAHEGQGAGVLCRGGRRWQLWHDLGRETMVVARPRRETAVAGRSGEGGGCGGAIW
uniref:Uncharacterized protein n=1 Tax=Triticum urartu TaxID=4572 RepID=A0A8R7U7D3_TRIUA